MASTGSYKKGPKASHKMTPKGSQNGPRAPWKGARGFSRAFWGESRPFWAHPARSRPARSRNTRAAAPPRATTPISSCGSCAGPGRPRRGHRWPWGHPPPLTSLRGQQEGSAKREPKNEGFEPKMAPGEGQSDTKMGPGVVGREGCKMAPDGPERGTKSAPKMAPNSPKLTLNSANPTQTVPKPKASPNTP